MIAKAKIIGLFILGARVLVNSAPASTSVQLAWDPSPDAVAGYKIYAGLTNSSQVTTSNVGNVTSAFVDNLTPGQTYSFYVTAYTTNNAESSPSTAITYTPPASSNPSHFVRADAATHGNWPGFYGNDGTWLAGVSSNVPSYESVSTTASQWLWNSNTSSSYAPYTQNNTTNRIAACWYSNSPMTFSFTVNDGQSHRLAMYFLDWTGSGRQQRVELIDTASGSVLDAQTLTNFSAGVYLVWEISGNVGVRITPYNVNAVVSGIFFDPVPNTAALFASSDLATRGNWKGVYGSEGNWVAGVSPALPAYSAVVANSPQWVWGDQTSSPIAPLLPGQSSGRIAACWYSATRAAFDFSLSDGKAHRVSIYLMDWTASGRQERVDVVDRDTGATLDSRTVTNFSTGTYLTWDVRGNISIRLTPSNVNAVASAIFFDPTPASVTLS